MSSFAAVDLGASGGRVILGTVRDGEVALRHLADFPNDPVALPDGLHWNLLELYWQVQRGLASAVRQAGDDLLGAGIDSWAVDYGLVRGGVALGIPYHYRDERTTAGVAAVHGEIASADLYRRNGLQHLPFNTLFQLACDRDNGLLGVADRFLLIPDLLAFWLTGEEAAERTNASTTGLLSPQTRDWDWELARRLQLAPELFAPLVDAGTPVGLLSGVAADRVGAPLALTAVGTHDTASAVVAVPSTSPDVAYVSCGTWGLVGVEVERPILSQAAREANFTNEGGVDGRIRFLRNVSGLWLLSESIRTWEPDADPSRRSELLQHLLGEAAAVDAEVPTFDVLDQRFVAPGDLPGRIGLWFEEHGQRRPGSRAELVRSTVESLAAAFADTVREASRLSGRTVSTIHVVGGGARNQLLCQALATRAELPVVAGPVEATAMGNLLVQARAAGVVEGSLESLRAVVAASTPLRRYTP